MTYDRVIQNTIAFSCNVSIYNLNDIPFDIKYVIYSTLMSCLYILLIKILIIMVYRAYVKVSVKL